jgi:hypothetical protein
LASLIAVLMPIALLLGLVQTERSEAWSDLLHSTIARVYEEERSESENRRGAMAESRRGRERSLSWDAVGQASATSTVLPGIVLPSIVLPGIGLASIDLPGAGLSSTVVPGMTLQLQPESWHCQTLLPPITALIHSPVSGD